MKKVFLAEYESRNFSFQLVATNERKARALMLKALRKHGRDYDCVRLWFYPDDIAVHEMPINVAFRDHSKV
jgi:hypothetical protein